MITIIINEEMIKAAQVKAEELGVLKNSITGGDGNEAGFLGEFIVANHFGCIHKNTYDYDMTQDEVTWEVKTKRCTTPPSMSYDASVAATNTAQNCDRYVFVRVLYSDDVPRVGYVMGWMDKQEYFDKAVFHLQGEIDQSNGFKFKRDCYNVAYSDLNQFETEFV